MTPRHPVSIAFAFAAALALAMPLQAGQIVKHSGSIVSVDPAAGTLVLAELGPWQVKDGQTVVTHRTVTMTAATAVALARRAPEGPTGFSGDFVETVRPRSALTPGDFVTIESEHEGTRIVALKITVADLQAP
jgi:hypothetical protein